MLELRADFAAVLREQGWIDPPSEQTQPVEGEAGPGLRSHAPLGTKLAGSGGSPAPEFRDCMRAFQQLEGLHSLPHAPALLSAVGALLDEPRPFAHPRHIARVVLPRHNELKTLPHQDWIHVQGAVETLTAWVPLGRCRREDGALAVLLGSSNAGLVPLDEGGTAILHGQLLAFMT